MRIDEVQFNDARPVEGYGPGFFRIGGEVIHGAVLTGPSGTTGWSGLEDAAPLVALAAEVEESVELVREALAARGSYSLLSLDAPAPGVEGGPSRDVAPVEDREAERSEARLMVAPVLAGLAARERDVLRRAGEADLGAGVEQGR